MEDRKLCSLCSSEPAFQVCICSDLPLFCPNCKETHQSSADFHFPLPLQALTYITSENQAKFKTRFQNLANSSEKLKGNMQVLEQFSLEIETAYEEMYREIDQRKAGWLFLVDELKATLAAQIKLAEQEVYEKAYQADYKPSSYMANLLWTVDSSDQIPLFSYYIRCIEER